MNMILEIRKLVEVSSMDPLLALIEQISPLLSNHYFEENKSMSVA
jgi:hypothetical protein